MKTANDFAEDVCLLFPSTREWWRNRLPESMCVWSEAMRHPILTLMPANGIIPQVAFLLVFVLLPILRRIHFLYPD